MMNCELTIVNERFIPHPSALILPPSALNISNLYPTVLDTTAAQILQYRHL